MTKIIELTMGKQAIVDDEDYQELSRYKWTAIRNKNRFYAVRYVANRHIKMHTQIMETPDGLEIDHFVFRP